MCCCARYVCLCAVVFVCVRRACPATLRIHQKPSGFLLRLMFIDSRLRAARCVLAGSIRICLYVCMYNVTVCPLGGYIHARRRSKANANRCTTKPCDNVRRDFAIPNNDRISVVRCIIRLATKPLSVCAVTRPIRSKNAPNLVRNLDPL